mmetsp:Transcript_5057/g.21650  ORF Transcript_5057/g.21650 Transcript_5057/m.21650 type:complete len:283 (+) Transcript_5057:358-1206(+)
MSGRSPGPTRSPPRAACRWPTCPRTCGRTPTPWSPRRGACRRASCPRTARRRGTDSAPVRPGVRCKTCHGSGAALESPPRPPRRACRRAKIPCTSLRGGSRLGLRLPAGPARALRCSGRRWPRGRRRCRAGPPGSTRSEPSCRRAGPASRAPTPPLSRTARRTWRRACKCWSHLGGTLRPPDTPDARARPAAAQPAPRTGQPPAPRSGPARRRSRPPPALVRSSRCPPLRRTTPACPGPARRFARSPQTAPAAAPARQGRRRRADALRAAPTKRCPPPRGGP